MEEKELVKAAQKGDKNAMEELCKRYLPLVKKYSYSSHVRTVQKDMESELWLVLVEAIQSYNPESNVPVPAYFKSRITFALWNRFKKLRTQWQKETPLTSTIDEDGESNREQSLLVSDYDVPTHCFYILDNKSLQKALSTLSKDEQELLHRHYYKGHTFVTIAKEMGCTKQNISYRHRQIIKKLRTEMERN